MPFLPSFATTKEVLGLFVRVCKVRRYEIFGMQGERFLQGDTPYNCKVRRYEIFGMQGERFLQGDTPYDSTKVLTTKT